MSYFRFSALENSTNNVRSSIAKADLIGSSGFVDLICLTEAYVYATMLTKKLNRHRLLIPGWIQEGLS